MTSICRAHVVDNSYQSIFVFFIIACNLGFFYLLFIFLIQIGFLKVKIFLFLNLLVIISFSFFILYLHRIFYLFFL